jgi:hypothetical protein
MLTIKLMSLHPTPKPALYTVHQHSTELEIFCGATANCGLGSWLLKFPDHTQSVGHLCTSDQSVTYSATYTAHNKHNRPITVLSEGFEPATPEIKRLHKNNLDRTVTGDRRLYRAQQRQMQRKHTVTTHKIDTWDI